MLSIRTLSVNSRFYILTFSILLSAFVLALLRIQIPSDQLYLIRTQQAYGLLAVIYLYIALIISPISFIIGKKPMRGWEFARRAIGVSAFYFAFLHGAVALWGQLGGPSQLQYLPSLFKWSLLAGSIAFIILLCMTVTSLDKVVRLMTYPKWKWLHRFVYAATILLIVHIWTIGTHLAYSNVQITGLIALVILFGLELYKTTILISRNRLKLDRAETLTLFLSTWLIATFILVAMPTYVKNYHSRHASHESSSQSNGLAR